MEGSSKQSYNSPDENEREKWQSGGCVEVQSMTNRAEVQIMTNTAEVMDVVVTGAGQLGYLFQNEEKRD